MNIKQDDYQELLNQLSIVADRSFTESQVITLINTMQTLGWSSSYRIVMAVVRSGNLPRNIYGYLLSLLEEEIHRLRMIFLNKEDWQVDRKDCVTSEEFRLTMKCISLIARLHRPGNLLERFSDYLREAQERGALLETLKRSVKYYTDLLEENQEPKVQSCVET